MTPEIYQDYKQLQTLRESYPPASTWAATANLALLMLRLLPTEETVLRRFWAEELRTARIELARSLRDMDTWMTV